MVTSPKQQMVQGQKQKVKLPARVLLKAAGQAEPVTSAQLKNRNICKSQIGLNERDTQWVGSVFSPKASEIVKLNSGAPPLKRTVTPIQFQTVEPSRLVQTSLGVPYFSTLEETQPPDKLMQAYRTEKGFKKLSRAHALSSENAGIATPIPELGIQRQKSSKYPQSQALALVSQQLKTTSCMTKQHSPARDNADALSSEQLMTQSQIGPIIKKHQIPKGSIAQGQISSSVPHHRHEKTIGAKRVSVALIPAAKRERPSPMRSYNENLAVMQYSTAKPGSQAQPQSANKVAQSVKALSVFSSKRNSASKHKAAKEDQIVIESEPLQAYFFETGGNSKTGSQQLQQSENRPQKYRKNSSTAPNNLVTASNSAMSVKDQIFALQDKLAQLQAGQSSDLQGPAGKGSKAERGNHYQKKSKKAQLHESGQFSPTTSKLIKHFLSKQKINSALTATLGGEKKSVTRKTSFVNHKEAAPSTIDTNPRKQSYKESISLQATQSQRSSKQRRQSAQSAKKQQHGMNREMFKTMIPPSGNLMTSSKADATQNLQSKHTGMMMTVSQHSSQTKKGKRPGSSQKNQLVDKHAPYRASVVGKMQGTIPRSGSSKKLMVDKVKPPIQKNNYMTTHHGGSSSPRQASKIMVRMSQKRDSQSSIDQQATNQSEKKMAFSQSLQQLERQQPIKDTGGAPLRLTVKKIKRDSANKEQLMRSLDKLQLQQVRAAIAKESSKSHQVSASDSSSAVQTIVTINKHAYFATDTFSDKNGGVDSEKLVPNQQDLFVNSDTNALAVAMEHSRSNMRKTMKRAAEIDESHKEDDLDYPKSCQQLKEKSTPIFSPSGHGLEATDRDRVHRSFDPNANNLPVSPIYQNTKQPENLFDNVHNMESNLTHLFSGRSSGDQLRQLVTRMSDQAQPNPATSKEVIASLEAMQKIIIDQESLIKQFQRDVDRQEGVITRYEQHIKQLEANRTEKKNSPLEPAQPHYVSGSDFTDRESSSLHNPSSHCNQPIPLQRQTTDVLPAISKQLSRSELEVDKGAIATKYNLTEKSSKSNQRVTRNKEPQPKAKTQPKPHELLSPHIQRSQGEKIMSESRLLLLEEQERMRLKLRKRSKREHLMKQKINKLMFFFFTLQNKGVPVNEVYEQEGIKAIRTDRFDDIMAQIARDNGDTAPIKQQEIQSDGEFSFYSSDSYDNLPCNPDILMLPYKRPSNVPALDLEELPEYETTTDEEEEQKQSHQELEAAMQAASQGDTMLQRESMSQTDYRKSLQYIENFYNKQSQPAADQSSSPLSSDTARLLAQKIKEERELEDGMVELADCPVPRKLKNLNEVTGDPLETPKKILGELQHKGDQVERCSSAQLDKHEECLEMIGQVRDFEIAEIAETEKEKMANDRNSNSDHNEVSSLQISLLSSPSKKQLHQIGAHAMMNSRSQATTNQPQNTQTTSFKHKTASLSMNFGADKLLIRSQASQQSQSQLESIDMLLSHDQQTVPGGGTSSGHGAQ